MRLSIIIPAYNVADYIEKCIRSLEDQNIPKEEYEIIVTNDGSSDDCKIIVEKLQKEFSNIVLLNQENQGVSMARNNAIAIAKGNYILPIDPDDYVFPTILSRILEKAEQQDLDVLYLGYEILNQNGKSIWKTDFANNNNIIYKGIEGYFLPRGKDVKDHDRSVAILYKKELLSKYQIEYPKGVPYLEDGLFLGKVFTVAKEVGFDNQIFYQRTTRIGSATNSSLFYSEKAVNGFLIAAQEIREFGKKYEFNGEQKGLINHVSVTYALLSLFPLVNFRNIFIFPKVVRKLKKIGFLKMPTQGVVSIYLQYAKYFNISPYYFMLQYSLELFKLKTRLLFENSTKNNFKV